MMDNLDDKVQGFIPGEIDPLVSSILSLFSCNKQMNNIANIQEEFLELHSNSSSEFFILSQA